MGDLYSVEFWKDAGERTIFTALAAAVAVLGGDAAFDAVNADWKAVGVVAANAAIFTFIKTLLASNAGAKGTGGFTKAVIPASPSGAIGEFRHAAGGGPGDTHDDTGENGKHHLK